MRKSALLALMLCLSLTGATQAQNSAPVEEWSGNEAVVVTVSPGPAMWRLTRPDYPNSEVWVLGTVDSVPRDFEWNRRFLIELVQESRAVIMPPGADVGLLEAGWFYLTNMSKLSMPRGQTLEGSLPEPLRSRFIRVRTSLDIDEDEYAKDIPAITAFRLMGDFRDKYNLSGREPRRTIQEAAREKRVPIAPVARYQVIDIAKDVLKISHAQQQVCLGQALEDIERQAQHAAIAGRAWAVGDIKTVKAHYSEMRAIDCAIAAVQKIANLNERQMVDYVNAIQIAATKPGKTLVTIGMGPWLRKNGVYDRLKALHFTLESPPE